jgi:hypothetical protein
MDQVASLRRMVFAYSEGVDILQGLGPVSKQNADALAETEFTQYQEQQRVLDDAAAAEELDAEVKRMLALPKKPIARKKKD